MLKQPHFYHRITRKMVVVFGNLFNNMEMIRYTLDGITEIERIKVPLSYASKEKFFLRLREDPTANKPVQITLPRMSFELTGVSYDPLRKSQANIPLPYGDGNDTLNYVDNAVPYNFNFNLYLYVRNVEDGTQLMEQILPFFNQDLTLSVKLVDGMKPMDIPFVLDTTSMDIESDPTPENERVITYTFSFVGKGYYYGPVKNKKLVRKAMVDMSSDTPFSTPKYLRLIDRVGDFQINEVVYQGDTLGNANARGFVVSTSNNEMKIDVIHGRFESNVKIVGAVTNSMANIDTYIPEEANIKFNQISVTPLPNTANINADWSYNVTSEWRLP